MRERLPNRRPNIAFHFEQKVCATVQRVLFSRWKLAEMFLTPKKIGTPHNSMPNVPRSCVRCACSMASPPRPTFNAVDGGPIAVALELAVQS